MTDTTVKPKILTRVSPSPTRTPQLVSACLFVPVVFVLLLAGCGANKLKTGRVDDEAKLANRPPRVLPGRGRGLLS